MAGSNNGKLRKSRRKFLTAAGTTGSIFLAGCGGDGGSGDGSSGNGGNGSGSTDGGDGSSGGTLEMNIFSGQLSSDNLEAFHQYVSEWESESGWSVNVTETAQAANVTQTERSRFEAGNPFDVMTVMGVAAFNFAANDYLASLDSFLEDSSISSDDFAETDLIQSILNAEGPFNGTVQVIPMMIGHWGALYYHAGHVEQAGYDPMSPQDYFGSPEGMLNVARDIKEEVGIRPLGFSGADHIHTGLQFYSNAWSRGDLNSTVVDGKPQYTADEFIGAAEMYETMSSENLMPQGTLSNNAINSRNLMIEGQTSMYLVGSWESAIIKEESDIEFGITYVPTLGNASPSGFGGSPTWGIAKSISDERKRQSWSLLEYLMTAERQAKWSGLVPSLSTAWDAYFEGYTDGLDRDVGQVFQDQISNSGWPYLSANVGTLNSITQSAVQNIISGKMSAQKAMEQANQQANQQAIE
ncbi:ABC transporter substrate-binding protein [Haloarcula nitratireducens]|uniref:Extracellular solute-binding protein n=1 Tax=Haloarcula nitratireducens TaxID=2487749 RepID=A0AAW4PIC1_9EURY|nr:extracellular solute-binding protein [Halomicroarcula nitratireducens]MBX0296952.1 extracellular solute-binding protein [Halomicroarcula nitratireducens]